MLCKRCGKQLQAGEAYCGNCGTASPMIGLFSDAMPSSNQALPGQRKAQNRLLKWIPMIIWGVSIILELIYLIGCCNVMNQADALSTDFWSSNLGDILNSALITLILPLVFLILCNHNAKRSSHLAVLILSACLLFLQVLANVLILLSDMERNYSALRYFLLNVIQGSYFLPAIYTVSEFSMSVFVIEAAAEFMVLLQSVALICCAGSVLRQAKKTAASITPSPVYAAVPERPMWQPEYKVYPSPEQDNDSTQLLTQDICRQCGRKLSPRESFCPNCGAGRYQNGQS